MRPICSLIAATLRARVSASSRLRSSDLPLGSPTIPVAPPARAIGRWPASWKRRNMTKPMRLPTWRLSAVGSTAVVERDRPDGEPLAQRVEIGGDVDESTGLEIGDQVHLDGTVPLTDHSPSSTLRRCLRPTAARSPTCQQLFADFAQTSDAPLYADLAAGIAEDPQLAGLLLAAPPSQRLPVLLFASVHWLLLAEPDAPLARFYPNLPVPPEPCGRPQARRDRRLSPVLCRAGRGARRAVVDAPNADQRDRPLCPLRPVVRRHRRALRPARPRRRRRQRRAQPADPALRLRLRPGRSDHDRVERDDHLLDAR